MTLWYHEKKHTSDFNSKNLSIVVYMSLNIADRIAEKQYGTTIIIERVLFICPQI